MVGSIAAGGEDVHWNEKSVAERLGLLAPEIVMYGGAGPVSCDKGRG